MAFPLAFSFLFPSPLSHIRGRNLRDYPCRIWPSMIEEKALGTIHDWVRAGCRIEALGKRFSTGVLIMLAPLLSKDL